MPGGTRRVLESARRSYSGAHGIIGSRSNGLNEPSVSGESASRIRDHGLTNVASLIVVFERYENDPVAAVPMSAPRNVEVVVV